MTKRLLAGLAAMVLCSCATIVRGGGPQPFTVRSNPAGADVTISDAMTGSVFATGRTPFAAILPVSKGFFQGAKYRVTLAMPGYETAQAFIDTRVSGWYVGGNLLFGGLIGWLIVDPATGAMWTLSDEFMDVPLSPSAPPAPSDTPPAPPAAAPAPAPQASAEGPHVAVLDLASVPLEARGHMVPVN
jgi:hypothetical protein